MRDVKVPGVAARCEQGEAESVGRRTHSNVLLALPHALSVCLDLLIYAVTDTLRIGFALQPGDAFMFGLGCWWPEKDGEGVGVVRAVDGRGPGG